MRHEAEAELTAQKELAHVGEGGEWEMQAVTVFRVSL